MEEHQRNGQLVDVYNQGKENKVSELAITIMFLFFQRGKKNSKTND
jgi:hypothetical protein